MPITRTRVTYLSPKDDCHAALLALSQSATRSLHIDIYSLTMPDLVDVLIAKHRAGLDVGVVCDHTQSAGVKERPQLQRLVDAGVPVTVTASPTGAINHIKAMLVDVAGLGADADASYSVLGSFNFSGDAADPDGAERTGAQREINSLTVDNDPALCLALMGLYREGEAFGRQHPAWQVQRSAPSGS